MTRGVVSADQTYYPSMVVNLKLHFDEAYLAEAKSLEDPISLDVATNQRQIPSPTSTQPEFISKAPATGSFVLNRIPKSCNVELPGYRQAGQFSLSLDFQDLPVDPRAVRSAAVEIHLGAISPSDFARGVTTADRYGARSSILKTRTAAGAVNPDTLLMVGIVDDWSVDTNDKGSIVSMKGRDLRGYMIDTPCSLNPTVVEAFFTNISTESPIDEVVQSILFLSPSFRAINVVTNPDEWPNKELPSPWTKDLTPRHRHGAKGKMKSPRSTPNMELAKVTYWDLIVRMCYLCGAIPYFKGADLVIRPSRSIFEQSNAGTALNPTPFAGGRPRLQDSITNAPIDPPLHFRRLAYGRDMASLSFDRKFAGFERPRVIRVVSVDTTSDKPTTRLLTAQWPPKSAKKLTTRESPGGEVKEEETLNIPVAGINDPSRLEEIAKGVYEEIGRGALGGTCETPNLSSFGGDNADPDLLKLRPGDGVEFVNDTRTLSAVSPLVSTVTDHYRRSFAEEVKEINTRLGDPDLARVVVATSRGNIQQVQRFFRTSTVKFDWSTKGLKISFDFQNYIVVRDQIDGSQVTGAITSFSKGSLQTKTVPKGA
jgi:hypothetical protein